MMAVGAAVTPGGNAVAVGGGGVGGATVAGDVGMGVCVATTVTPGAGCEAGATITRPPTSVVDISMPSRSARSAFSTVNVAVAPARLARTVKAINAPLPLLASLGFSCVMAKRIKPAVLSV